MEEIITWMYKNIEWLFSGIGCLVIGFLIKKGIPYMKQKSGKNSINIQSSGNIYISGEKKHDK